MNHKFNSNLNDGLTYRVGSDQKSVTKVFGSIDPVITKITSVDIAATITSKASSDITIASMKSNRKFRKPSDRKPIANPHKPFLPNHLTEEFFVSTKGESAYVSTEVEENMIQDEFFKPSSLKNNTTSKKSTSYSVILGDSSIEGSNSIMSRNRDNSAIVSSQYLKHSMKDPYAQAAIGIVMYKKTNSEVFTLDYKERK